MNEEHRGKGPLSHYAIEVGVAVLIALTLIACRGDSSSATGPSSGEELSISSLTISPDTASLTEGTSRQLDVSSNGVDSVTLDSLTSWRSADTTVATVTGDGVVTAIRGGHTRVIARAADIADTAYVRVISEPLFYDGFESGDYSKNQNGYGWEQASGQPDSEEQDGAPAFAGDWAARFRQTTEMNNRLLRFTGPKLTEFWFEYQIRIPGPDGAPPGEGNEYTHSCQNDNTNNKWVEMYSTVRNELLLAPNTRPTGNGGSYIELNLQRHSYSASSPSLHDDWIVVPDDRSEYQRLGYHVRLGTPGEEDGLFELYKNGARVFADSTMDINGRNSDENHINHWQIMGWNNCQFPESITWYVDEVRLYANDPGW